MHYKKCINSPDQEGLGEAALGVNINHLLKVQQVRQQRPRSTFVHLRHNNLQHKNVPNNPDGKKRANSCLFGRIRPFLAGPPAGRGRRIQQESKTEPLHLSYVGLC